MNFKDQTGKLTWLSIVIIAVVVLLVVAVGGLYAIGRQNLREDRTANTSGESTQPTQSSEPNGEMVPMGEPETTDAHDSSQVPGSEQMITLESQVSEQVKFRPISSSDHVLGDIGAPVQVIEYMDLDCPFCTRFHQTVIDIMQNSKNQGRIAWVYRHFPLTTLHADAKIKANATECVAEIGGNTYFWLFVNKLFETEERAGELARIASELGVSRSAFEACMEQEKYFDKIDADYQEAKDVGAIGTPHSIIVVDGEVVQEMRGALSQEVVQQILDDVLRDLPNSKG